VYYDDLDFGIAYMKSDYSGVKVTMNSFRDRTYIHIREYLFDPDEEVWFPTKKGYALNANEVDTVIHLLTKASKKLSADYKPDDQLEFNFEE
jgi:hypothetical protein